ncbi:hypothetical protein C7Y66_05505 [Chroococcidiopsis sp. CCALA 051]|uniref:hypothetical protein n=1 Tax=Chroococcidiopsis sp. CCALA 051 TaxID=869949 RepID=UPI000D07E5C4|nr:hypothetical protein [Chroococcidiopsis sp. CCALA 051]MBE9016352.1 hypothetical protein [Chroococcidiopsidales cyanobacterium LEGE 13417]PSB43901.1 hypothetical protein C7B80_22565 [Cyanosarcina cf. burmensis CCALA 770]PSM50111.1 hypothetical protein C7Y66_05505 [Chroococcidiopsis sp. CCALA 051]
MTPEAIRIVTQLRREFYSLFATEMRVPVIITNSNSSASNPSIASWVDRQQRLNYVYIYVHLSPDELIPNRPFLLKLAINKGAGIATFTKQHQDYQKPNQRWYFELTLLPEEILDFLPWIVSLVQSHEKGFNSFALEPPHPFEVKMSHLPLSGDIWTQKAGQQASHTLVVQ